MSQSELATSLGISFQQVQKYESGVSGIAERRLEQICKVLDLPPSFFEANHAMIGKPAVSADSAGRDGTPGTTTPTTMDDAARLAEAFATIEDKNLRSRIMEFVLAVASDQVAKGSELKPIVA